MKRRILAIVLAIVLAAVGTAGVLAYVRKADSRAIAGLKAVTVLIAQQQIPSGTPASTALQDGSLASQRMPASSVPADALSSISGLGTLVLSSTLQPGQLLLRPMLVTAAESAATGGIAIPKGLVAVTVQLCLREAVADYVYPGADVAVFDTYSPKPVNAQETCDQSHTEQTPGAMHTRIVLPRVEVLSVTQAPASAQGQSAVSSTAYASSQESSALQGLVLVTLAVDQADAERVILTDEEGLPWLALLSSSSQTKFDTTTNPLFQG